MSEEKRRAGRNRTMVLTEADRKRLLPKLVCSLVDEDVTERVDSKDIVGRIINRDLMEVVDRLPEAFADLIVIDPPYNLSKDFGGYRFRRTDDGEYLDYVRSWLPKVMRCLKPNGSVYVCCDWQSSNAIYQALREVAVIKNRITWQREKGRGATTNWKNAMEDIWFAVADDKNYYFDVEAVKQKRRVLAPYRENGKPKDWEETSDGNFRLTHPSNFWDDICVPYWSMPENTDHPTQKPEKLIAKLILASCPKGGVVFDPFVGSGTTAVVAKKLGRKFCGVEMNEEYALLALKRLEKATHDRCIQGYEAGVFLERNTQKKTPSGAR